MKNKTLGLNIGFILIVCGLQMGCSFTKDKKEHDKPQLKALSYEDNLIAKIRVGSVQEIQGLLISKRNLNFATLNCETPLAVAAIRGSDKIIHELLENGASPYFRPECLAESTKASLDNSEAIVAKKQELKEKMVNLIAENKVQSAIDLAKAKLLPQPLQIDIFAQELKNVFLRDNDNTIVPYLKELVSNSDYHSYILHHVYFETIAETLRAGAQNINAAKKIIGIMGNQSNSLTKEYGEDTRLIISTELLLRTFTKSNVAEAILDYKELLLESGNTTHIPEIEINENNLNELIALLRAFKNEQNQTVIFQACDSRPELSIDSNREERAKIFHLILFSRQLSYFEYHGPYSCHLLE
ncbi:hypothetical protein ACES2L_11185 [Bdellovibrio bacteriovorus]